MAGDVAFQISLQDDVSPAASSAAGSLAQMVQALQTCAAALQRAGAGMTSASDGSARVADASGEAADAVKGLTDEEKSAAKALKASEAAEKQAAKEAAKLANEQEKAAAAAKKLADEAPGRALKELLPGVGDLVEKFGDLKDILATGAGATTAAAAAIALVGVATLAAAAAFLKFGIAAADAAQHLRAVSIAQTGSVETGTKLAASIAYTANKSGVAADELSGYAAQLHEAGVAGRDMQHALSAAAGSSKLFGSSAGDAFVKSAIEAKKAGKSVAALATETKAKLGPGLAMELNRPTVALDRLGDSISGLFGDADVSGFGAAINMVSDALAKGSAVGDAFRAIFEALFGGLGANAQSAGSMVTAVLEEMTILALKVAIFVKPAARSLSELWDSMTQGMGPGVAIKAVVYALAAAFVGVGVVAGVCVAILVNVAATIGAMVAVIGAAIGGVIAFGAAVISGIVGAVQAIPAVLDSAKAALAGWASSAIEAAANFISGLVSGITGGAGMVVDAIKGLASNALGAFKGVLGIASPSRVMLQMGGYTAEGFAGGMDAGAAVVESSASTLAAAPIEAAKAAPPAALPAPRAVGGGGGGSVDIGGVQITINGVAGAEAILEKLPAALADAFEQIAETMGIQPAEA